MSQFYNPFNFVPLNDNPNTSHDVAYETIASGESHITHQLWQRNALSGAIFLSITNHSDLIVGGERKQENEEQKSKEQESKEQESKGKTVKFFKSHVNGRLGKPNQLAIPANSLRGAIASVAETISDSAMRVLADEYYSVRAPADPDEVFSQVGIVVEGKNGLKLKPLTVGAIKQSSGNVFKNDIHHSGTTCKDKTFFKHCEDWKEVLPVSLEFYKKVESTYKFNFPHVVELHGHQLARNRAQLECYHGSQEDPKYVYIRDELESANWNEPLSTSFTELNVMFKSLKGLKMNTGDGPEILYMTEGEFKQHLKSKKNFGESDYRRYVFFYKGDIDNREKRMVADKKYELLVPYSKNSEQNFKSFPISEEVRQAFVSKLRQQPDDVMIPNSWKKIKGENFLDIHVGDLLYFKGNSIENGHNFEITELSLSQIWRKEVTGSTTHGILSRQASLSRYLPFGSLGRELENATLTPAEQIFGVVEDREINSQNTETANTLSSRVRFYDAVRIGGELRKENVSLTLSSPKPISPAMYLHGRHNSGVGKADAVEGPFHINGRKRYIQHKKAPEGDVNTGTDGMLNYLEKLPSSTTPNFGFWIEFDNLSQDELSLLLLSTGSKQSGNENPFYHQIGMGKPYGFGKSELEVLTVLLKDPQQRYLNLSDAPSYSYVLSGYEPNEGQLSNLKKLNQAIELPALSRFLSSQTLRHTDNPLVNPVALAQVSALADESQFEGEDIGYPMPSPTLRHTDNPLVNPVALVQVSALADESQFEGKEIGYPMPSPTTSGSKIFEWFGYNEQNKQRQDNPKNKKPVTAEYQFLGKLPKDGRVKPLTKMEKPPTE